MNPTTISATQHSAARIAGFAYLIIIVAGVAAEFLMRSSLIVSGDATTTVNNILESETLFRSSIVLDLIMIGADMIVAVALYALLRPINRHLALLAALFRVVMDSILGVNLLNLLAAVTLVQNNGEDAAFGTEEINALAMSFIDAHALGYSVGLVPFAFATFIVGYLLFKSDYVPRVVSVMMVLAGLTYLTGSTIHVLAPDLNDGFSIAYAVPFVAESTLAIWLVFKGVALRPTQGAQMPAVPA